MLYLIEGKLFESVLIVSANIESKFLEKYFGTNEEIKSFAKELLLEDQRLAVKELNKTIKVLGDITYPELIINKISEKFMTSRFQKKSEEMNKGSSVIVPLSLTLLAVFIFLYFFIKIFS